MCACVLCVSSGAWYVHGGQRTTFGNQFCPSLVLEIKFSSPGF